MQDQTKDQGQLPTKAFNQEKEREIHLFISIFWIFSFFLTAHINVSLLNTFLFACFFGGENGLN